jgi:hypothetical protein
MQNFDHNIGFKKNANFFAENCQKSPNDHNIDPRLVFGQFLVQLFQVGHHVAVEDCAGAQESPEEGPGEPAGERVLACQEEAAEVGLRSQPGNVPRCEALVGVVLGPTL